MRRGAVLLFTTALVAMVMAVGIAERPAYAATITVNTNADDSTANGNCTLREAITAANKTLQ